MSDSDGSPDRDSGDSPDRNSVCSPPPRDDYFPGWTPEATFDWPTKVSTEVHEQQNDAIFQENTVADSGYISACASRSIKDPNSHEEPREHENVEVSEAQSGLAMDQQTVYTCSVLPRGSDYINDLCNDIHLELKHDLQEHANDRARAELAMCLPDLIKAFSIRIGLEASVPARAHVMHFLHTHCKDIVAGLDVVCQHREDSPESDHRNTDDEGMTVTDRIELWIRKQNVNHATEPKLDSLFEGIKDIEEEDIASNARMAMYRDVVLSSNSYQWFIKGLRKQLSLDWGSDDLTDFSSCRSIYHSLMSMIPPGIISRHRTPEIHRVTFGIQMHPDVLHYLEKKPVAKLMTLTSSAPNIVQALPVHDYLQQTWPSEGLRLAGIIQMACEGEYGIAHTDNLDDGTWIAAQLRILEHLDLPKLLVTISGSRYSISECGEQLAWLCAAFQRPLGKRSIARCTCNIENQQESEWSIRYSMNHSLQEGIPMSVGTARQLCDATIIQGFPTQKRPSLFDGLELGLDYILDCIGAFWPPVFENGRTVLKGSYHILEMAKQTQTVSLWHVVHSGSANCSFSECPSRNEHCMSSFDNVLQTGFMARENRHIVANMEYLGVPVASPDPAIDKNMGQTYSQIEAIGDEIREEIDTALSPAEYRSSNVDSSGESLDSDMLSVSSANSDCIEILDPEGTLAFNINQVSHRILAEYMESRSSSFRCTPRWAPRGYFERGGDSDKAGISGSSSNQPISREASQLNGAEVRQSVKRSRANDDEEDQEEDDGGFRRPPRPTKRPKSSPNKPPAKILACPFWKLDSQTNRTCFRMKCSRIGDVKYHLSRKHRQPASEYCQRCWTAFQNEAHKKAHLSDESDQRCKYDPAARPVGIDNNMAAALHKKSNPKQCTADQWFAIWDIVFPGQPRPSSPYIDDSLAEDATQLQEHIVNRWPSIIATELETWELAASETMNRLGREHLIRETLARLSDEFSAEQARMRAARTSAGHQSPGTETPSSSVRADSAIEMGSYQSRRHASAGPSNETYRSIPRSAAPQLETHFPVQSQSSVMRNGRERFILPRVHNSFNVDNGPQQTPMPPQNASPGAMPHDSLDTQTTDFYGASNSFENELSINDQFPRLAEGEASQNFLGSCELDTSASLEFMEAFKDFDWAETES